MRPYRGVRQLAGRQPGRPAPRPHQNGPYYPDAPVQPSACYVCGRTFRTDDERILVLRFGQTRHVHSACA